MNTQHHEPFREAIDDLAWRHQEADEAVGIRGQNLDGSPNRSFDGAAASRMVDARVNDAHRFHLAKREKIDHELAQLRSWDRVILNQVFEPFGRATPLLSACFTIGRIVLIRVALETESAQRAYTSSKNWSLEDGWQLLDWFETEARSLGKSEADIARLRWKKPTGHIFDAILRESNRIALDAIMAYDAARAANRRHRRQTQEQELARELSDPRFVLGAA